MARSRTKDQPWSAWRVVRIGLLLLVLAAVAMHSWLDRVTTQSWQQTLWVGIYPLAGDGTAQAQNYLEGLTVKDFAAIETFFAREARRYGVQLAQPVHLELYPQGSALPPVLPRDAGALGVAWWSLKLRWFAFRAGQVPGRVPVRIRLFVQYHDPSTLQNVPDSHGLQKGLVGVVHLFADPERDPRYPQEQTEIMAGRRPVSAQDAEMPRSLREVIVGPATAREIKWTRN